MLTLELPETQAFRPTRRGRIRRLYHIQQSGQAFRDDTDSLLFRASTLPPWDRGLLQQHLSHGVPLRSLARNSRRTVASLRRRIRSLKRRLRDPRFLAATHYANRLPHGLRQLTHDYYLHHLTLRRCARKYAMTLHGVRQAILVANAILTVPHHPRQHRPHRPTLHRN